MSFVLLLLQLALVRKGYADAPAGQAAQTQASQPEPPARFQLTPEEKLDRNYNVPGEKPLPESEPGFVPVYSVLVPASQVSAVQSKFLDPQTRKLVMTTYEGKEYVRFFFRDPHDPELLELERTDPRRVKASSGVTKPEFWGTKHQSHSTYKIRDQEGNALGYIKFREANATTKPSTIQAAIAMNDYAETILREEPDPFISMFPEHFGAFVHLPGQKILSYSVRSAEPMDANAEGLRPLPVHGFLGSPELEAAAKASNMTTQEWVLKEYIPKLARFIAETNYKYGLYTEAHTQNLLFYVNSSGKITGFVFRDLADASADPFTRVSSGKEARTESLSGSRSAGRLGHWDMGVFKEYADVVHFSPSFLGNYIVGKDKNFSFAGKEGYPSYHETVVAFGKSFVAEVEKVTGIALPKSRAWVRTLEHSNENPELLALTLFDQTFNEVAAHRMSGFKDRSREYNQDALMRIFYREYNNSADVAYIDPFSRFTIERWAVLSTAYPGEKKPLFSFDGKNIVALDPNTRKPMAMTYSLSEEERAQIEKNDRTEEPRAGFAETLRCVSGRVGRFLSGR